jgi:hypothetical protein
MADNDEATLLVQVKASLADFSAKMDEFNSIIDKSEKHTEGLGTSWQETAKGFLVGQFAVDAIKKVYEELVSVIKEGATGADEQAVAMVRLRSELGAGADAIAGYADQQQKLTRFRDDDTLAAAKALTIHKLNREEIEKLLPVILDFAADKGVSATQTAEAFGRAIQFGTTRGLHQFGIEVEKNGSQLEIFNTILDAGQGKVKGMAEKIGQTALGPMEIFKNQLDEISEKFAGDLLPEFNYFLSTIAPPILSFFSTLADLTIKSAKGVGAVVSVLGSMWGGKSFKEAWDSTATELQTSEVARSGGGSTVSVTASGRSRLGTTPIKGGEDILGKQHDAILNRLDVIRAMASTRMAEIDSMLDSREISIEQWYTSEAEVVSKLSEKEIEAYQKIIKTSKDQFEIDKARNAISKIEIELKQKQIDLADKYAQALAKEEQLKKRGEDIVYAAQGRILPSGLSLEDQFAKEEAERKRRQREELEDYRNLRKSQQEIDDLANLHEMENAQRTFEFKKSLKEQDLQVALVVASSIKNTANDIYEITGRKSIALFNISKIAAISEAEINGAVAATKAYNQLGAYGWIAAAALELATQAHVATIIAQQPPKMRSGGMAIGPSHEAGGVNYNLEGGEYIHSRYAVGLYGARGMDAINRGLVPPSVVRSYSGGVPVASGLPSAGSGGEVSVSITNIQDPRMIDRHLASSEGRSSYINFLGQNKSAVRAAIGV